MESLVREGKVVASWEAVVGRQRRSRASQTWVIGMIGRTKSVYSVFVGGGGHQAHPRPTLRGFRSVFAWDDMRGSARWSAFLVGFMWVVCVVCVGAGKAEAKGGWSLQGLLPERVLLLHDNDVYFGTDRMYSSGLLLEVGNLGRLGDAAQAMSRFFFPKDVMTLSSLSVFVGHQMYTPNNITIHRFVSGDRPFAGWLFGGVTYRVQGVDWRLRVQASLGVVGPWAFGDEFQTTWHWLARQLIQSTDPPVPQGWRHQLPNEMTMQLSVRWSKEIAQIVTRNTRHLDLSLLTGGDLGTVWVRGMLGLSLRFGYIINVVPTAEDLPWLLRESAYHPLTGKPIAGNPSVGPHGMGGRGLQDWELYVFLRPVVRFVARNLFLDGAFFQESHSVTKVPVVVEGEVGFSLKIKMFRLTVSAVFQSAEGDYERVDPSGHRFLRIVGGYEGF